MGGGVRARLALDEKVARQKFLKAQTKVPERNAQGCRQPPGKPLAKRFASAGPHVPAA